MGGREHHQPDISDNGQRLCARGEWCGEPRLIRGGDGLWTREPALTYRAFCGHDSDLIGTCIRELPAIYGRLQKEIGQPSVTETSVHVPFGPSVPLRMDIDAAMRVTAALLQMWESRVIVTARLDPHDGEPVDEEYVAKAARTLAAQLPVLLALQPDLMTITEAIPAGRKDNSTRTTPPLSRMRSPRPSLGTPFEATCLHCGRHISRSAASGYWYGAYRASTDGLADCEDHEPQPGTVIAPLPSLIPAGLEDMYGDAEILRFGADFLGLWVERDGAAAGLEILHLHYWNRAVLRETPARPEELLGVECRRCSLRALRRAEPPWHKGDPEYWSECAECGHLLAEDDYRMWTGQLHAYHKARLAAMPVLGATPVA